MPPQEILLRCPQCGEIVWIPERVARAEGFEAYCVGEGGRHRRVPLGELKEEDK